MSNAVLILRMPESCISCKLCMYVGGFNPHFYCRESYKRIKKLEGGRPDWCPLVRLPDGDLVDYYDRVARSWYESGYNDGRGACSRNWFSVRDEEKPEDGQVVNVITKRKDGSDGLDIVIYRQVGENGAFYTAAENEDLEIYGMHVTHWASVPDFPPKMDGGSEE